MSPNTTAILGQIWSLEEYCERDTLTSFEYLQIRDALIEAFGAVARAIVRAVVKETPGRGAV
jgi:hypothetical protein